MAWVDGCPNGNAFLEWRGTMSNDRHDAGRDHGGVAVATILPRGGPRGAETFPEESAGRPRLRVRTIERTALVRFEDAAILFEESAVQAVSQQLHRLIQEEGHTRLLVNFAGVRHLSSDVLAIL